MNKVWIQITGSHSTGQPEMMFYDKYPDKFICGWHSMVDTTVLRAAKDNSKSSGNVFWNGLPHTGADVVRRLPSSGYEPYSWAYHNKIEAARVIEWLEVMKSYDPQVFFVFFATSPMLNVQKIIATLKSKFVDCSKVIYYKRRFWEGEVEIKAGHDRLEIAWQAGNSEEFNISKDVEKEIIAAADRVYLADSLNTKGDIVLDDTTTRNALVAFRDQFLAANKKVVLQSLKGKAFDLYNEA